MEEIENKGDAAQCCARVATKGLSSFSGVGKGKAARRKEETQRRRITGIRVQRILEGFVGVVVAVTK